MALINLETVVFVVLLILVFVACYDALRHASPFPPATSLVLAIAGALLGVIGIWVFIVPRRCNTPSLMNEESGMEGLLLPWAAMALSMLFIMLLSLFRRWAPRRVQRDPYLDDEFQGKHGEDSYSADELPSRDDDRDIML